jgi:hypothetical protein
MLLVILAESRAADFQEASDVSSSDSLPLEKRWLNPVATSRCSMVAIRREAAMECSADRQAMGIL